MHITNIEIFNLLYTYSYFVLFPLVVVEGPIVTIIAGFLVSTGFMDFPLAYLTIVLGDLTGDYIYYSIGRWWFNGFIHSFFNFLKFDTNKVKKIKKLFKNHQGKVLFFGKLSHAIGAPILIAAGLSEVPIKDFLWFNFLATLPKSLILLLVGFYFGSTLGSFNKYLNWTILVLVLLTIVMILLYWVISKWARSIIDKLK